MASRRVKTAAAFAADTGVVRTHGSYTALLANPEIDAVYIPLPSRGTAGTLPFETITVPAGDGFRAEAFARLVRGNKAGWNGASEAESIDTARSLEAILASLRGGGWVELDREAA